VISTVDGRSRPLDLGVLPPLSCPAAMVCWPLLTAKRARIMPKVQLADLKRSVMIYPMDN
jgi:hypothetical protein